MAIDITLSGNYTLDETADLQNGADGTPSGSARDDSDVSLATLQAQALTFYNYLFTAGGLNLSTSYPTSVGVAASPSDLINVTTDGALSTLALTDANGDPFDGDASGLTTTDGDAIFLWSALDGSVVLGKTAGGDVAFAVYMQPDGALDTDVDAKLWSVTFEPLDHPTNPDADDAVDLLSQVYVTATGSKTFNFDALPSGQNLFGIVGDVEDAIVVCGELPVLNDDGTFDTNDSDTINTSKGGGPTTIGIDNQQFNPAGGGNANDDGCFFTYVEDPDARYLAGAAGGLNQNEADDADNVLFGNTKEVDAAFLKIVQVVGNGTASLSLTAYDLTDNALDGRNFVENGMGAEGGSDVDIDHVWVYNGSIDPLNLVEQTGQNLSTTVDITITNGVASISGLDENMVVVWHTTADHDQVLVRTNSGSEAYDIGLFGLLEGDERSVSLAGRAYVEDDGPAIGPIADSTVKFETGTNGTATKPLLDASGTDLQGNLEITDFDSSFQLLDKTIIGTINGDNTAVHYFEDVDDSGDFNAGDVDYYTLSITQLASGNSYTFTVNNAPEAPPLEFDFTGLPSGQNLFGMVCDAGGPDGAGALFFAKNAVINDPGNGTFTNASATINTSKGGGPTTIGVSNQMVDPGEGVYFTMVNDPLDNFLANVAGGLTQNEADDADNMVFDSLREVPGAFMRVSQTQGNEVESCTVEAFNIVQPAAGDERDLLTASGQGHVDITYIAVYEGSVDPANLLEKTVAGADGGMNGNIAVSIDAATGIATVSGLEENYLILWETDGDHDQVLITGTGGKFDIGGFGLSEPQDTPDHSLEFEVTLTDGDGDWVSDSFLVNIDAAPFA